MQACGGKALYWLLFPAAWSFHSTHFPASVYSWGPLWVVCKLFETLMLVPTSLTTLYSLLCLQERASADGCRGLLEQEGGPHDAGGSPLDAFAWGSIVLGNRLDISSEFDRRLSIGASIACRLRGAIRKELGNASAPGVLRGWHLAVGTCCMSGHCSECAEAQMSGACTATHLTLV